MRLKGFDYTTPGVYFLTLCSYRNRNVFTNRNMAEQTIKCLKECSKRGRYKLHAYCLMPDHLHVLVNPLDGAGSVSQYVQTFKSLSTRIFWRTQGKGKLWQRGSYDHVVRKEESLIKVVEYILANPVRKGLVEATEDYPFSGTGGDLSLL